MRNRNLVRPIEYKKVNRYAGVREKKELTKPGVKKDIDKRLVWDNKKLLKWGDSRTAFQTIIKDRRFEVIKKIVR